MASPTAPTANSIVTEALERSGVEGTTAEQTRAESEWLEEAKAILTGYKRWRVLEDEYVCIPTVWSGELTDVPSDFGGLLRADLIYGSHTGTVQSGSNNTATLAASETLTLDQTRAKRLVITDGTGARQYRWITNYDEGTKIATVAPNWTTNPNSSSTYLVEESCRELHYSPYQVLDRLRFGKPEMLSIFGGSFTLSPVPDDNHTYVILMKYDIDLAQMDEDDKSSKYTDVLRLWRAPLTLLVLASAMQDADQQGVSSMYKLALFLAQAIFRKDSFHRPPANKVNVPNIGGLPG